MHLAESWLFPPFRALLLRKNGFQARLGPNISARQEGDLVPLMAPDCAVKLKNELNLFQYAVFEQDTAADEVVHACFKALGWMGTGKSESAALTRRLHIAYETKSTSPVDVCNRIIDAVSASENEFPLFISFDPKLILQQAQESEKRWLSKKPLSFLDGIPFAVKDEIDVEPFPTTLGTSFLSEERPVEGTSEFVVALKDAGAILLGKTTMQEIGLGTTGLNLVLGTTPNPYNADHFAGGSSSGSAAIVASGLVPFAHGADGGGSLRIPAAFCGIVALKPTHGRICGKPKPPVVRTVAVDGPLGATVADCMVAYTIMANRGHVKHGEEPPPPLEIPDLSKISAGNLERPFLKGLKIGIEKEWFQHADSHIVQCCEESVKILESAGAEIVEINLPIVNDIAFAHTCTISMETLQFMNSIIKGKNYLKKQLNSETRISLATANGFTNEQYEAAQLIRREGDKAFQNTFSQCDIIVSPTVPQMAPKIPKSAMSNGLSDLGTTTKLMRYMQSANFLGLPAITLPVGMDPLPIGLQIMANHWNESLLFWVSAILERKLRETGKLRQETPEYFWQVLQDGE